MTRSANRPAAAMTPQQITLRLEGLALAGLCVLIYGIEAGAWGLFALLILAPDVFMLGYLANRRLGALCYNIGHSWLAPLALAGAGVLTGWPSALPVALIWGTHIGVDRALGYGLKYGSGFRDTHLSRV
ncbi:hypothetical protein FIU94_00165 [Sulfitobacter sp. THAF37]|uniref:DUF4260 domain-containing protein n=1 Tax=Sulfitobacter sp. THAF37 TaxID=2587855 RepID=UPI0012AA2342|nr:DUF4260 domain-containing protein [Sulfitobacter sp. THAF37]QFT57220.1 hypothetical protein FIU94_00165 [Sulfitobacter sp. THAF37]